MPDLMRVPVPVLHLRDSEKDDDEVEIVSPPAKKKRLDVRTK